MDYNRIIAIMGPSGSGKTTLADNLANRHNFCIPRHCTTRLPRSDDKINFYRYFTHEEYKHKFDSGEFLISSGDGPIIDKKYGNFYGVLKEDCIYSFQRSDTIILFTSYKDIDRLISLERIGFNIKIINLTFKDIEQGVRCRLIGNSDRDHTMSDINRRIDSALSDNDKYRQKVDCYADLTLFTDVFNIEETYNKVYQKIKN